MHICIIGGNYKVYLATVSDGGQFAVRWNLKQDRSTMNYEKDPEKQNKTAVRMKKHIAQVTLFVFFFF